MATPTYTIFSIDPSFSLSQLAAYRTLRLMSLQIDPQAFGSNYAREVAFSEDIWQERLSDPFKRTFVASVQNNISSECKGVNKDMEEGEWVGMASIIGPSALLPSVLEPFRVADVGSNWEAYALCAMWVHPAHRGKGVGIRLIEGCLDWARTNVDPKFPTEHGTNFEKVAVLLIYDNNAAGRALYLRAGFTDVEGVSSVKEGETWMSTRV